MKRKGKKKMEKEGEQGKRWRRRRGRGGTRWVAERFVAARNDNQFVTAVGWRRRRSTCRPAARRHMAARTGSVGRLGRRRAGD